jgi:hypothetical protein
MKEEEFAIRPLTHIYFKKLHAFGDRLSERGN